MRRTLFGAFYVLEEIKHFINCINTGKNPLVSGEAGRRALETAIRITELLGENKVGYATRTIFKQLCG
jgi:predicted dehydrogenase